MAVADEPLGKNCGVDGCDVDGEGLGRGGGGFEEVEEGWRDGGVFGEGGVVGVEDGDFERTGLNHCKI